MLSLTISLFLYYDLANCHHYGKRNFSEDLLMKRHHQNFLQIKDFIKDSQHRFHEEKLLLGVDNELTTTRDAEPLNYRNSTWWWDNSSFIDQLGLNSPRSLLLPLIRSRPSFPFSITPYTTELNDRHLKWDEIFPEHNARLRSGAEVTSKLLNRSLPQSSSVPSPKAPNSFGSTFQSHYASRPILVNTTFRSEISLTDNTDQGFGLTAISITPNEDYMMWLREITMYTPVEMWLQTLANKIGVTPSYGYTTNRIIQVSRTPFKPQTSDQDFKDQPHSIFRQGLPQSDTPTKDGDYRIAAATTKAQFFIENVSGILHLRTVTEQDERTTMMVSGRPETILDDADKVTPTTERDVLHREQDPEKPGPSFRKSRMFHSKSKKKKRYHHSYKRKRTRQSQKHSYGLLKYSDFYRKQKQEVEYPMLRRMRETIEGSRRVGSYTQYLKRKNRQKSGLLFSNAVTRPTDNTYLREPTYLPTLVPQYLPELHDTEDEKFIKRLEAQDNLRLKKTDHVKESLKAAEKKEKDKRLKSKAELIRKIVAGSSYSYSDEEATLRKNLVAALLYGNRNN